MGGTAADGGSDLCGVCWVGFAAVALGGGMLVEEEEAVEGIMRTMGDKLVVVDGGKKLQIPTYLSHTQPRIFDSTMAKNIPIFEPPV